MQSKNKYCCNEHMDIAFDDFLVENETFPILKEEKNFKCNYCNSKSEYELSFSEKEGTS